MARQQRIEWLDIAKGGSILLVALFHAQLYASSYDLSSYSYYQLSELFHPIRMPLFFLVSGILGASATNRPWTSLLTSKILLFIYILLLWTFVRWVYFGNVQVNVITPSEGSDPLQLVKAFVQPDTGLWFIWALSIYFVLAKLFRNRHPRLVLCAVSAVAFLAFSGIIRSEEFVYNNSLRYAPFFLFGAWFGQPALRLAEARPVLVGVVGSIVFVGGKLLEPFIPPAGYGAGQFILCIAGVATGCIVAKILTRTGPLGNSLRYFGRMTLPIYVAHVIPVALGAFLIDAYAANLPLVRYWSVPLIIASSLTLALGLKYLADAVGAKFIFALPSPLRAGAARLERRMA